VSNKTENTNNNQDEQIIEDELSDNEQIIKLQSKLEELNSKYDNLINENEDLKSKSDD
jgi:hypothetical protein